MIEAERCWGPNRIVKSTNDPALMQERMIRMMMGNWTRNSFKAASIDELELSREDYACYRIDQSRHVNDGPTMAKTILDIMNPEAQVNVRELKKKIGSVTIEDFKGDVPKMLTHM